MRTPKWIKDRIAQLDKKREELERAASDPGVIPGPFVAGHANYKMGKALDRENERRWKALRELTATKRQLSKWKARLADWEAGECDLNGRRIKNAPSSQRRRQNKELVAEFMRDLLKPGDRVALVGNLGIKVTVRRVNKKTITDEYGYRWEYHFILPLKDDEPMTADDLMTAYKAFRAKSESNN